MHDKQTIIRHLTRPVVSGPANFLNEEETREFARVQRRIISHSCSPNNGLRIVFFSDNRLFGYQSGKEQLRFVPSSSYLPMAVTERPGLESGIVNTFDEYNFVFNSQPRDRIVYDFNELVFLIKQYDLLVF